MPGQGKTVSRSRKKVMNIKEVANYLGVHTSTIYKYAQQGTIPAFKIGSDWRFSLRHIDLWIDEKMNNNGK
jgi:excisionase family DNA binding protein